MSLALVHAPRSSIWPIVGTPLRQALGERVTVLVQKMPPTTVPRPQIWPTADAPLRQAQGKRTPTTAVADSLWALGELFFLSHAELIFVRRLMADVASHRARREVIRRLLRTQLVTTQESLGELLEREGI